MIGRGLLVGMMFALAACGGGSEEAPNLLNISQPQSAGPDEFAILPSKPLEMPQDMAALPAPTPGGVNRADLTPANDVAAALGGNASILTRASSGDVALLAYIWRYGRDPNIRATLAAADLEFRRENDGLLLERLFSVNIYYQVYEPFELDQYAELERLRRAGIQTSSVPPDPSPDE